VAIRTTPRVAAPSSDAIHIATVKRLTARQSNAGETEDDAAPGDLGVMVLDMFASVADGLTSYQDAAASEAYLGSACDPPC
jgi:hypothetical protein